MKEKEGKMWYQPAFKCISDCKITYDGKKYKPSEVDNVCVEDKKSSGDDPVKPDEPEKRYNFKRTKDTATGAGLFAEFQANRILLKKYVKDDAEERKNKKASDMVEKECNYLGRVREELGEDMETTLACDCQSNGFGSRC